MFITNSLSITEVDYLRKIGSSSRLIIQDVVNRIQFQSESKENFLEKVSPEFKEDYSGLFLQIFSEGFNKKSIESGYEDSAQYAIALLSQASFDQVEVHPCYRVMSAMICNLKKHIPVLGDFSIESCSALISNFLAEEQPPEEINLENWQSKLAIWKTNWEMFETQIKENSPRNLFPDNSEERKKEYDRFIFRIQLTLPILLKQGGGYDFLDHTIPYLLGGCYTAWDAETLQLEKIAFPEDRQVLEMLIPQQFARDLRRQIVFHQIFPEIMRELFENIADQQEMMSNVHYQAMMRQCANDRFHLGYTEEELGVRESLFLFGEVYDKKRFLFSEAYSTQRIKLELIKGWNRLTHLEKELILINLIGEYRGNVDDIEIFYQKDFNKLKHLYQKMEQIDSIQEIETLKNLRTDFLNEGFTFPFDLPKILPLEILENLKSKTSDNKIKRRIDAAQKPITEEFFQYLSTLFEPHLLEGIDPKNQIEWNNQAINRINQLIASAQNHLEERIVLEKIEEIKSKIVDRSGELTSFGAVVWGVYGKVLESVDPSVSFLNRSKDFEEMLIGHIEELPALYEDLSGLGKMHPKVEEMRLENPGIFYGASKQEYWNWFRNPLQSLIENPKSASCFELVLEAVKQSGYGLDSASLYLRSNREIVLAAVDCDGFALGFASELLRKDREVVLRAIAQSGEAILCASIEVQKDVEMFLAAVEEEPMVLQYGSDVLKSNPEIVLKAVQKKGISLEFASEDLKANKEIVLAAIREDGFAFQFVDEELKKDPEIAFEAVQKEGELLEFLEKEFKEDKKFVRAAIQNCGAALRFASETLRQNRELVFEALKSDGTAYCHLEDEFKICQDIVIATVKSEGNVLYVLREPWKSDREITLCAVKQNGFAFEFAISDFQKDLEIVLIAVEQQGCMLSYVDGNLQGNKEVVLKAVGQNGLALEFASKEMKEDREVVSAATLQYGLALEYADEQFRNDPEIVRGSVRSFGRALQFASRELKEDREIVCIAVEQDGLALEYAGKELQKDREIVRKAICQNRRALAYVDESLMEEMVLFLRGLA